MLIKIKKKLYFDIKIFRVKRKECRAYESWSIGPPPFKGPCNLCIPKKEKPFFEHGDYHMLKSFSNN